MMEAYRQYGYRMSAIKEFGRKVLMSIAEHIDEVAIKGELPL